MPGLLWTLWKYLLDTNTQVKTKTGPETERIFRLRRREEQKQERTRGGLRNARGTENKQVWLWRYQTELGSACFPCNKASSQTLGCGRRRRSIYLQSSKEYREPMFKRLILSGGFQGRDFKGESVVRTAGCMTFFWLVGVAEISVISLLVPTSLRSTCFCGQHVLNIINLVSAEQLKDTDQIVICTLQGELGVLWLLFKLLLPSLLDCFLFLHFPLL